jgi:hypothetical protein
VLLGEVEVPVLVEVAVADDGAQGEDCLCSVEAPSGAADVEAVGDVAAGALDDPGGDGPALREGLVVAEAAEPGGEVAGAGVGSGAPGRRLYRLLAAVVGVAAGGGVRPGRDREDGPAGPGAGEEPAVGCGQARRLRGVAGPGPGAGGGAAPVGGRAVHPVRPGTVGRGAPDAAHEPAVHRPPGCPAPLPGGPAAAGGEGQAAIQPGGDRRVPRARGCPAHDGAADARDRAGLPGGGRRADPRRPARRARHRRRLPVRRRHHNRPGRAPPGRCRRWPATTPRCWPPPGSPGTR